MSHVTEVADQRRKAGVLLRLDRACYRAEWRAEPELLLRSAGRSGVMKLVDQQGWFLDRAPHHMRGLYLPVRLGPL